MVLVNTMKFEISVFMAMKNFSWVFHGNFMAFRSIVLLYLSIHSTDPESQLLGSLLCLENL